MADLMCTRLEASEKDDRGKTAEASAVRQERGGTGTEAVGEAFIPATCDHQTQETSAVYKVSQ